MNDLLQRGERRHELCRYGCLTKAWRIEPDGSGKSPMALPLCTWRPKQPHPPAMTRAWGGGIELDRDCAVCAVYEPLA